MNKLNINQEIKSVHFCGVCGIGMSAVALFSKNLGLDVQGSDICKGGKIYNKLIEAGIKVFQDHDKKHIEHCDAVVYSTAISSTDNDEILYARLQGKKIYHRSEFLNKLMSGVKNRILITGSHGKTTTSSLSGFTLDEMNLDPTIIVGGVMHNYQSNAKIGSSDCVVVENDESDGSLLNIKGDIGVVTNIDFEHMSYYKTKENLLDHFTRFINGLKYAIVCADDDNISEILSTHDFPNTKIIKYGTSENADIVAKNIKINAFSSSFDVFVNGKEYKTSLNIAGVHNVVNSLSVIALCQVMGLNIEKCCLALPKFGGVSRRMTNIGSFNNVKVIDDYAHHTTEISVTLNAIRNAVGKDAKILCVFEPHRYSRIFSTMHELSNCFKDADHVAVWDIYTAGETDTLGITKDMITNKILDTDHKYDVSQISNLDDLKNTVNDLKYSPSDIIVFMGAGKISDIAYEFIS